MSVGEHFVELRGGHTRASATTKCFTSIDLSVDLHQIVCLIGASGSGKSTLLRCLNLLETVDAGTIEVDGEVITDGSSM